MAIENNLAACINVFPVQSFYPWEGQLQQDHEFILILKTFPELNAGLQRFIENNHSYKIPGILHWDAEVNESYADWMKEVMKLT